MDYSRDIDKLRHSCSHIMAQAVKELWPDVKVTIGPAIDTGFYYDFDKKEPFSDDDLMKITKKMRQIIERKPVFTQSLMNRDEAIKMFADMGETYKVELINGIPDEKVSIYKTGQEWFDLCKGPHVADAGQIKGFKLLSVAGAYWRGDETKPMLQRIYGTAFFSQKELDDYLKMLEEAQKRDHRKIATQLDLFHIYHETAGAGLIFYHPPGALLRKIIEDYIKDKHLERGYDLVSTPNILKGKLWEISGHAGHYKENMYYFKVDNEDYAVKPMNCPGHILIFQSKVRSYRDLPIRYFELGTVYRQEKAGVLHGLLRVRGFTQDDAHIFCRPDQIKEEVIKVLDFVFEIMKDFGFHDLEIELSTQPENSMGEQKNWDTATQALKDSLEAKGINYKIDEGGGAFYGPKIDIKLKDAIGRQWQCGTVQCDFNLPERFELKYIDENGAQARPIMLHRALLGSLERFIGTMIEHYAGNFPVWLAPTQVAVIPIKVEQNEFAQKIKEDLKSKSIRVMLDNSNETLGKRIREATLKKIPYVLVIGQKEVESSQVSVRKRGNEDLGVMSPESFQGLMLKEIVDKK